MTSNEKEFVDELEDIFKQNGFQTFREVIPDQCENWEKPYRVDLIVYRNDTSYIAIEAKYLNTLRQGSIIAEAFEQIKKYQSYTYLKGNMIKRWCIAPFYNENTFSGDNQTVGFIQNFLRFYGVSFLVLNTYKGHPEWDRINIDALTKSSLSLRRFPFIKKEEQNGNSIF